MILKRDRIKVDISQETKQDLFGGFQTYIGLNKQIVTDATGIVDLDYDINEEQYRILVNAFNRHKDKFDLIHFKMEFVEIKGEDPDPHNYKSHPPIIGYKLLHNILIKYKNSENVFSFYLETDDNSHIYVYTDETVEESYKWLEKHVDKFNAFKAQLYLKDIFGDDASLFNSMLQY